MPIPKRVMIFDEEREERAIIGYLARYAAFKGLTDPDKAFQQVLKGFRRHGATWEDILQAKIRMLNHEL